MQNRVLTQTNVHQSHLYWSTEVWKRCGCGVILYSPKAVEGMCGVHQDDSTLKRTSGAFYRPLVPLEGSLQIKTVILTDYLIRKHSYLNESFLQDDGAHISGVKGVTERFDENYVNHMVFPLQSPDLNPSEHLREILDQ